MTNLAKLNALRATVYSWIYTFHNGAARFYDPAEVGNLFSRFNSIRDELRAKNVSYFSDLPVREVKSSETTDHQGRGYFTRGQLESLLFDIEYCINLLSELETVSIPSMKLTREGIFFAGQFFDSIKSVGEIFAEAKQSIVIIDAHVDRGTLDLLTCKNSNVEVKLLTKDLTPALRTAAIAFNKQYGLLNIRTSNAFHDRFVIIDNSDFYHFGTSVNIHLGKRGFMFSRIEEPEIITALSQKFDQEWNAAQKEI